MKAQSSIYVKLQSLYKAKARQDISDVMSIIRTINGGEQVNQAEVELFCRNAKFIKLVLGPEDAPSINSIVGTSKQETVVTLTGGLMSANNGIWYLENELLNDELAVAAGPEIPTSLLPIYLALRASTFASRVSAEDIVESVTTSVPSLSGNKRLLQIAEEIIRSNLGEIHNTSAATGGIVAQEMIKLITKQYVPIDNTCIFDGIESRCQVLRFNLARHQLHK